MDSSRDMRNTIRKLLAWVHCWKFIGRRKTWSSGSLLGLPAQRSSSVAGRVSLWESTSGRRMGRWLCLPFCLWQQMRSYSDDVGIVWSVTWRRFLSHPSNIRVHGIFLWYVYVYNINNLFIICQYVSNTRNKNTHIDYCFFAAVKNCFVSFWSFFHVYKEKYTSN